MSDPRPFLYRFGSFEADVRAGELRRDGMRLKLSGQPFAVLTLLLEHAGEVVTRDQLRQALWPADTYVDFDHSLNTAINKLRAALADSGSNPRFVETLARRGYRFIAPVMGDDRSGANPQPVAEALETSAEALPRPHRGLVRALLALVQALYLALYIAALSHFGGVEREAAKFAPSPAFAIAVAVLVLASIGIPIRCFLFFAVAFDYRALGAKFRRLFPALLLLDEAWGLTPFLLADSIGVGMAFAAAAGLLYLPFGQRTLVRMGYE